MHLTCGFEESTACPPCMCGADMHRVMSHSFGELVTRSAHGLWSSRACLWYEGSSR